MRPACVRDDIAQPCLGRAQPEERGAPILSRGRLERRVRILLEDLVKASCLDLEKSSRHRP